MRLLELALAVLTVVAVAWPAVFGSRPRRGFVAFALTVGLVAQLQMEGFRWQMLPLYVVALGLAVGDVFFIGRDVKWTSRLARGVFGMLGVSLVVLVPAVMPVPTLPPPSGPHGIGTFEVELVDFDRVAGFGESPQAPRKLKVQVWYPAEAGIDSERLPWTSDWEVVVPELSRSLGFPSWFLDHTRYSLSHATDGTVPASGQFPVVVYSHGWRGFRSVAINQIEALASNGYVVIAPDHTFGAVATRFRSGEVIAYDPAALPDAEVVGEEAYAEAASSLVGLYAGDIVTVLDALDAGASGAFARIADTVDLTRLGLYGHSAGGGAVVQVCLLDERCDAVLGMDAWVEPLSDDVIKVSATAPSLFMRSESWQGTDNDALVMGIAGRSTARAYVVGISGADHNDFVATPLFSPIASQLGLKGPIAAGRVLPIIDNYLVGFFDVFLLGTGSAALDTVSFEEVTVEVFND